MTTRYELTRSIIYECPAVKLPQTLLQQIGMTAQILPLRGFTDEQAQRFVEHLNAGAALSSLTPAVPATPGGGLSTDGVLVVAPPGQGVGMKIDPATGEALPDFAPGVGEVHSG